MSATTKSALYILSMAILLFAPLQGEWIVLMVSWGIACWMYYLFVRQSQQFELQDLMILALTVRLLAVCSIPNLSDDFVRFIWDGSLLLDGINPYLLTPSEWMHSEESSAAFDMLYDHLNSPDYFSVYPPFMQGVFFIAGGLKSLYGSILVMKAVLFTGECITLYFLTRLLKQAHRHSLALYALNPLVIIEGIGNIHFEVLAVCGIALAIYGLKKKRWQWAGLSLGTAVSVKLNPILFLPLSVRYIFRFRAYSVVFWTVVSMVILCSPLLFNSAWSGYIDSLQLYIQTFEFNAGLYYVLRGIGQWWVGYNPIAIIGPAMATAGLLIILIIALYPGSDSYTETLKRWQWGFLAYLLCSTIIHPWYIIPLIFLSSLTGLRFPLVWSVLIFMSYVFYGMGYGWMYCIMLGIEYLGLLIAITWDIKKPPKLQSVPEV